MGATDVLFVSLDSCRYDTFLVAHRQGAFRTSLLSDPFIAPRPPATSPMAAMLPFDGLHAWG